MEIQDEKRIKEILEENNKIAGNLFKGSNVRFEYIDNRTIKIFKHSYPHEFIGYVNLRVMLRGYNWGFTFYKKDIKSYDDNVGLDNYQLQAVAKICSKLNSEKATDGRRKQRLKPNAKITKKKSGRPSISISINSDMFEDI